MRDGLFIIFMRLMHEDITCLSESREGLFSSKRLTVFSAVGYSQGQVRDCRTIEGCEKVLIGLTVRWSIQGGV